MDPVAKEVAQGIRRHVQDVLTERGYETKEINRSRHHVPRLNVGRAQGPEIFILFYGHAARIMWPRMLHSTVVVEYSDPDYIERIMDEIIKTQGIRRDTDNGPNR